jgi:uroporphyrinogen-III decarboxylase
MWCLRGFDRLMLDFAEAPAEVNALADIVFGFEEALIRELPQHGFDGVAFFDDWGTQQGMLISPALWRSIFRPRYERQFKLAHSLGLAVYFHCCGQVSNIIPDMIDIGIDLLNLSQPNLYDIPDLGRRYGGRVCFVCPVSYQTTSITGTPDDISRDVALLVEHLGCFRGGLVGYVEEYQSIGMSEDNYLACVDAFRTLGRYAGKGD